MNPLIAIISYSSDAHIPFVTKYLNNKYMIIDPQEILYGKRATIKMDKKGKITQWGDMYLENIQSVWYRKPATQDELASLVQPEYEKYSQSSVYEFIQSIYSSLEHAFWISERGAIRRANNKVLQLEIAKNIGFHIPETIITSNEQDAIGFVNSHAEVVVKSLTTEFPIFKEEETLLAFYTVKIDKKRPIDYSGLPLAPAIFQEAIDYKADLRVTVVGEKIFPAIILIKDKDRYRENGVRDWRIDQETNNIIEPFELPEDIAKKCLEHCKTLGLAFSAIDLVLDKNNKIWFLENNPNGQWAFIEDATGQPIGKSIANLLLRGQQV